MHTCPTMILGLQNKIIPCGREAKLYSCTLGYINDKGKKWRCDIHVKKLRDPVEADDIILVED